MFWIKDRSDQGSQMISQGFSAFYLQEYMKPWVLFVIAVIDNVGQFRSWYGDSEEHLPKTLGICAFRVLGKMQA